MEILNTFEYTYYSGFLVFLWICILVCVTLTFISSCNNWVKSKILFGSMTIILCILSLIVLHNSPVKTRYEVSFNEDYSVSELVENYDIIDQHGDIWILEDKVDE